MDIESFTLSPQKAAILEARWKAQGYRLAQVNEETMLRIGQYLKRSGVGKEDTFDGPFVSTLIRRHA